MLAAYLVGELLKGAVHSSNFTDGPEVEIALALILCGGLSVIPFVSHLTCESMQDKHDVPVQSKKAWR